MKTCPASSPPQEVLPKHNRHAGKGARGARSAPRSDDVHAAHATRLGSGRARDGAALVRGPAGRAGRGDGAARAGDVRPAAGDRAATRGRRAGGPTGGGAPAVGAPRAGDVRAGGRAGRAAARCCRR